MFKKGDKVRVKASANIQEYKDIIFTVVGFYRDDIEVTIPGRKDTLLGPKDILEKVYTKKRNLPEWF